MALYTMKWDYRFTFGKHRARRVDEVFSEGWYGRSYIAWVYYCKEDISFRDEVLDAVGISDRIDKPGIDREKYHGWLRTIPEEARQMIEEYHNNVRLGRWSHIKAAQRKADAKRLKDHEEGMERINGKGYLQWKNQGH